MDALLRSALLFGLLFGLMVTGMPVFICFMIACVIGAIVYWGGPISGCLQIAASVVHSVSTFVFLPIPLFILMGTLVFESGVGSRVVQAVDRLIGFIPARLSVVTISAGVVLGTMMGMSPGTIGILGRTLLPELLKKGYPKVLALGPVVASGTLAVLIPPSAMAILVGALSGVSIGKLLLAIVLPGLLYAGIGTIFCMIYGVIRGHLWHGERGGGRLQQGDYVGEFSGGVMKAIITIMPTLIIVFAVLGTIYLGIATPSEAAALGVFGVLIVCVLYRSFSFHVLKTSILSAVEITVMALIIITASMTFSRLLATTGFVSSLTSYIRDIQPPAWAVVLGTQLIVVFMGMFMDPTSIAMICVPLFKPLIDAVGYDQLVYATMLVLNIQLGLITPPFGLDVYTTKAVAPEEITLGDVFRASLPFLLMGYGIMIVLHFCPSLATWLPMTMRER